MNSVLFQNNNLMQSIKILQEIPEISHVELNFPEHVNNKNIFEIKNSLCDKKVSGIAIRFREKFISGEFTNPDPSLSQLAEKICFDAIDACRTLGGEVVTIWLGYDGFDYPFQLDYENKWNDIIHTFQNIADYGKDLKISIEYKPYEPRAYSMLDSIGLTLLAMNEINRENMGVTVDFCHMLMKKENPAYSLALAARNNKLFGVHLNDGYREMDNGLIFGSINIPQALEFLYYLKKYAYDGVIFFDSFPIRENAVEEIRTNIQTYKRLSEMIDAVGLQKISKVINKQNGISSHELVLDMLR
ncbi:MAG: sugar phosphate isomerase/epimerase family protein [Flexilinea sp.]